MRYFNEKISAKIYWSLNKNIPVFVENFKDEPTILVKATPPRDMRPALSYERKLLKKILDKYFKENYIDIISPYSGIILLNKISYVDAADEIIVGGQIIGHMFFDIYRFEWRFKPIYVGVNRMIKYEKGYYALVNSNKITRRYVIHRGDIKRCNLPEERGEFIAVSTKNGLYHGVGKLIKNNRIYILKSWRKIRDYELNISNSIYRAIRENEEWLISREEEAINFLKNIVIKKNIREKFLSFSGGKDSLAALIISLKAFNSIPILFNDTGLELPEVRKYVKNIAEKYELHLIEANAGEDFFKYVRIYGPPARDYRWCCKVIKLAPIVRAIRKYFSSKPIFSIVGQRRYESLSRAFSPRIWTNRWMPGVIVVAPILDWSCLETWLYILRERVEVNPLYFRGFDRLGCWLCPACEIAEFMRVKELYEQNWSEWDEFLEDWRVKLDLPKQYTRNFLWRWKKIMGDQRQIVGEEVARKIEERTPKIVVKIKRYKDKFIANFNPLYIPYKNNIEAFSNILNILGQVKIDGDKIFVSKNSENLIIKNRYITIIDRINERNIDKDLKNIVKIYLRANFCNKCMLCIALCPEKAIYMENDGIRINVNRCKKCLECNNICPVANYIKIELIY